MDPALSSPKPRGISSGRPLLYACLGCFAAALLLSCVLCLGGLIWFISLPEGGVRLGNEMERYALDYIAEHNLVEADETVLAYYDATFSGDGTEAAILTDKRLIYHLQGTTTSMLLQDIVDVQHREDPLLGDIIVAIASSGQTMRLEIARWNDGATFHSILLNAWHNLVSPSEIPAEEGSGLEMPTISGLGDWEWDGESDGYEYFIASAEDIHEDIRDCVTDDVLNSGMDLHTVEATISTHGHGWETLFTFWMADLDPGASGEWVVEIQNSLGFLMLNDASELDTGGLEPPPTLQSVSTFSELGYDLKVFDLKIPTLHTSAVAAAEGLRPWFTELTLSVRAETPSGPACDEFSPAG